MQNRLLLKEDFEGWSAPGQERTSVLLEQCFCTFNIPPNIKLHGFTKKYLFLEKVVTKTSALTDCISQAELMIQILTFNTIQVIVFSVIYKKS